MSMKAVLIGAAIFATVWLLSSLGEPTGTAYKTRDNDRLSDLRELSGFVRCSAKANENVLPNTLRPLQSCGGNIHLEDPFTNLPYSYQILDAAKFRICATFERAEALPTDYWFGLGTFDPNTGCATVPFEG